MSKRTDKRWLAKRLEEEHARERIARAKAEVQRIVATRICPLCGSALRRNWSLMGWWQCAQFGTEQFREDPKKPQCNWPGIRIPERLHIMSKRKLRRTIANPMRTVANIRAWIREHAEPEPEWDRHGRMKPVKWTRKGLDETLLWWFTCWQAQGWSDLRTKDVADILLHGLPPLTLATLQEELDSAHESEDESEPAADQLEAHLRQHFGLLTGEPGL